MPPANASLTGADGSYSVTLEGAALPCVIRVTKDGMALHSIVEADAALPARANVTPLTELLTAQVAGEPAAALFDGFDAAAQARLTAANVSSATAELVTALQEVIDLGGEDLLKGQLVPAVDGSGGNLLDQKLDALARALAESGISLQDLSAAVVANPGTPPEALASVRATASSCPALRSGEYIGIEPGQPDFGGTFGLDAQTGKLSFEGEADGPTLTPVAGDPCRFVIGDDPGVQGEEQVFVSRSSLGVSLFTGAEGGAPKLSVFFPKQQIALSELAGTWNYAGIQYTGFNTQTPINGSFTLNALGQQDTTTSLNCVGLSCESDDPAAPALALVEHPDGGFQQTEDGTPIEVRFYAFRDPSGGVSLFVQSAVENVFIAARREASVALPVVGSVSPLWDLNVINAAAVLVQQSTTVVDVDEATQSFRRIRDTDDRVDRVLVNQPRTGHRLRNNGACTSGVDGPALSCPGSIQLPLTGTGVGINAGLQSGAFFSISVTKP